MRGLFRRDCSERDCRARNSPWGERNPCTKRTGRSTSCQPTAIHSKRVVPEIPDEGATEKDPGEGGSLVCRVTDADALVPSGRAAVSVKTRVDCRGREPGLSTSGSCTELPAVPAGMLVMRGERAAAVKDDSDKADCSTDQTAVDTGPGAGADEDALLAAAASITLPWIVSCSPALMIAWVAETTTLGAVVETICTSSGVDAVANRLPLRTVRLNLATLITSDIYIYHV